MIEWIIVFGSGIAFIAQYIYVLGKLSAKMQNCEENVTWIRNFLLSKCTDSTHFTQKSAIKISDTAKDLIPLEWKDTLNGANIDIKKCSDPFDCVVKLSENQGIIRLKERAEKLGIEFNSFLLASAIHIFTNKNQNKI